jgi:hypothetical protein
MKGAPPESARAAIGPRTVELRVGKPADNRGFALVERGRAHARGAP